MTSCGATERRALDLGAARGLLEELGVELGVLLLLDVLGDLAHALLLLLLVLAHHLELGGVPAAARAGSCNHTGWSMQP